MNRKAEEVRHFSLGPSDVSLLAECPLGNTRFSISSLAEALEPSDNVVSYYCDTQKDSYVPLGDALS